MWQCERYKVTRKRSSYGYVLYSVLSTERIREMADDRQGSTDRETGKDSWDGIGGAKEEEAGKAGARRTRITLLSTETEKEGARHTETHRRESGLSPYRPLCRTTGQGIVGRAEGEEDRLQNTEERVEEVTAERESPRLRSSTNTNGLCSKRRSHREYDAAG